MPHAPDTLAPARTLPEAGAAASRAPLHVFVMGCSRGGTTLTQRLVAERLGLYTLPETRFFASMIGNVDAHMFPNTQRPRPALRRLTSQLREALGRSTGQEYEMAPDLAAPQRPRWSPTRQVTGDFITRLDTLARDHGAHGWLEKTPFHVHYARQIQRLVPDAWMVHIIRDARQTVASIWDAAQRYADPWPIIYDRIERAVDNWNASTADAATMVGQPRQVFIPYTALTAAPAVIMDEMARQMGLADLGHAAPMQAATQMTSARDGSWKTAAVAGEVHSAVSKWDQALDAETQARANRLIQPIPAALAGALAPMHALAGTSPET